MNRINKNRFVGILNQVRTSRRWFLVFTILTYVFFTILYMGPSISNCQNVTYGFGDNTAGPIWRDTVSPNNPIGGFITNTNFPFGENISSPVGYSLIVQSGTIWTMQKIAGSVCGYNLVNALGFVFSAMAMFCLIMWLTKNKWIALLAGYVASFSPYFQFKVGGHPSYGFQGFLTLGILFLLKLYTEGASKRNIVGFVLSTGVCFYWDPYFSLLAFSALFPVGLVVLVREIKISKGLNFTHIWNRLKPVFIGLIGVIIMLTPLLGVRLAYKDSIDSFVSGSRGDVMIDANHCSNLPTDYVIPPDANYFAGKAIGPRYSEEILKLRHGCNPSEDNVSISLSVLAITIFGLTILLWETAMGRKNFKTKSVPDAQFMIYIFIAVLIFASIMALPPSLGNVKTPTYILLSHIKTWRILAREFLVVQIAVVALFSIVLLYFTDLLKTRRRSTLIRILYIVLFASIAIQYQVTRPFSGSVATFDYRKNSPQTYVWLKNQDSIKAIADYPLDKVGESEAASYYLTAQTIHNKKILNSALPNSSNEDLRFSLKDLTDPQTIPALRTLGIDAVIIHSVSESKIRAIPGLELVHFEAFSDKFTGGFLAVAKIKPGPKSTSVVFLEKGFPINKLIMKSPLELEYEVQQGAEFKVGPVLTAKPLNGSTACFQIKMADEKDSDTVSIVTGKGVVVWTSRVNGDYRDVTFEAKNDTNFIVKNSMGHNMRINNLGCR
ncbi:MAG: hypothetical protein NTX11_00930 [Candidatus Saccharibacteria bacterium]|nr:hypothetical protein [Candidatus Saccharibacteria bacterium]